MQIEQILWTQARTWQPIAKMHAANLVLIFGGTEVLTTQRTEELRKLYPNAIMLGCSTAGEIQNINVFDNSITATAIIFEDTQLKLASHCIATADDSQKTGEALGVQLLGAGLRHVLVISDGVTINGTELVKGFKSALPSAVEVTGGLSGDGNRFQRTLVIANAAPAERQVAALGFYGTRLRVGYGSVGGWDSFGPDRLITKASGNVLYELDGKTALDLYKSYLGEHAAGLPATGLLFPLALHSTGSNDVGLVRTILSINEADQSMTFAGDMPEGTYVRLMKANFDRLIDGAIGAAQAASSGLSDCNVELAILISCVGRKLVLQQRVEEEVEGVRNVLGKSTVLTGFYSYGEISPYVATGRCELHNQTMTITTLSE
jgi:hypothetical protein